MSGELDRMLKFNDNHGRHLSSSRLAAHMISSFSIPSDAFSHFNSYGDHYDIVVFRTVP